MYKLDLTAFRFLLCCQNVRQHALSVLTDLFLDKNGGSVPPEHLSSVLSDVCVPLAGRRILKLQVGEGRFQSSDELMIEFELCIGLIFKPLRHHLQNLLKNPSGDGILSVWKSVLSALEELLCDDDHKKKSLSGSSSSLTAALSEDGRRKPGAAAAAGASTAGAIPKSLRETMNNLANEHLRNAIEVLIASGILQSDDSAADSIGGRSDTANPSSAAAASARIPGDITSVTVDSVGRMGISAGSIRGWKS
jgi:hypothetical protein